MSSAYSAIFGTPTRLYSPVLNVFVVLHGESVTVFDSSEGALSFSKSLDVADTIHEARVHEAIKPATLFRSTSPSASTDLSPSRCTCNVTGLGLMSRTIACPSVSCPKRSSKS
jgi:hypothetical protein